MKISQRFPLGTCIKRVLIWIIWACTALHTTRGAPLVRDGCVAAWTAPAPPGASQSPECRPGSWPGPGAGLARGCRGMPNRSNKSQRDRGAFTARAATTEWKWDMKLASEQDVSYSPTVQTFPAGKWCQNSKVTTGFRSIRIGEADNTYFREGWLMYLVRLTHLHSEDIASLSQRTTLPASPWMNTFLYEGPHLVHLSVCPSLLFTDPLLLYTYHHLSSCFIRSGCHLFIFLIIEKIAQANVQAGES